MLHGDQNPLHSEVATAKTDVHRRAILAACVREGLSERQSAYVLATAHHETRLGALMEDPTDGWRYEGRHRIGNRRAGDGHRFRPRGHAKLTGRTRYGYWARQLDLPLLADPSLAAKPRVAADILVRGMKLGCFSGLRLSSFVEELRADYVGARRVMEVADLPVAVALWAKRYEVYLGGSAANAILLTIAPERQAPEPKALDREALDLREGVFALTAR